MEQMPQKKWYQKKLYILGLSIGGLILASSLFSSDSTNLTKSAVDNTQSASVINSIQAQPIETVQTPAQEQDTSSDLSNDNYYRNVDGNDVHSPAYTQDNSIPEGASAQCGDGTYSFSQNRRGTCSHHGGVSQWLN